MTFKSWIIKKGLSESSAKNYSSALFGSISEWAKEVNMVETSLIEISEPQEFIKIMKKIELLPIFIERNHKGHNMYSNALKKYLEFLKNTSYELEKDIEDIISNRSYSETNKVTLIKTRIGQGKFRSGLLKYWKGCAITGYKTPTMLVASHIKPWRDSNNQERLDTFNGLLLTPNLDKAFDNGFISFDSTGKILISKLLEKPNMMGVNSGMNVDFNLYHHKYLDYHRNSIFLNI